MKETGLITRGKRELKNEENRRRLRDAMEIVSDTRAKVGPDYPIMVRLSTREFVPGGLSMAETRVIAERLEQAGVDAIDCSQGIFTVSNNIVEPFRMENGIFVDASEEIKKCVSIPVLTAGRINEANLAENVLKTGKADLVGMGRASLADPDFPKKVQEGRVDEIRYCIGCVQGCIGGNMRGENCHCLVNPEMDREFELPFNPVKEAKKIVVIGAGRAGMEAAIVAKKRGHDVTILEKADQVGGTWNVACLPLYKGELVNLIKWQNDELSRLGVEIRLSTEATEEKAKT